ncbi:P-loop containing nucleoside triphosphate hydrolase protein [Podospora aff. communis PSN243]|uniref:P-loop containing nucleoside triphosphate hydrolase protein n=1 Tax=Podospora aff. communis PSN243 TaxID=3040156 RepID=A0AAV9G4D0_9PEZI|nr:P-loop containing nucleoside triphosphate hydrolase protein [Podospora aff. communis PSN243]
MDEAPSPEDMFIAVMGITGAGKSTFISKLTPYPVEVGHGLESHTQEVRAYPFQHGNKKVWLVDTPGFDDTKRADIDVLEDLAGWLMTATKNNLKLVGIVHLHRITDVRLGGVAYKDLKMFQKLCGKDSFPSVVLGTTMWPANPTVNDYNREKELRTTFYQEMIDDGAVMMRVMNTKGSALEAVLGFIDQPDLPEPMVLAIQKELGQPGATLIDTAAGRQLEEEKIKIREVFEQRLQDNEKRLARAMEAKNEEMVQMRISQQDELRELLKAAEKKEEEARIRMQEDWNKKVEEKDRQLEDLRAALEKAAKDMSDTASYRSRGWDTQSNWGGRSSTDGYYHEEAQPKKKSKAKKAALGGAAATLGYAAAYGCNVM